MILRGNHHATAVQIDHRVVGPMMTELHLQRLRAGREAEQLMAEADAEGRHAFGDEGPDRGDGVVAGLRIAGPVGQEHAVRLQRQHHGRGGLCRHHGDVATAIDQHAQDVVLDAEIVGDDMQLAGFARRAAAVDVEAACIPGVGLRGGDHLGQIHAFQAREGPRRSECGFDIGCGRTGDDAAVLRTLLAQDARQAAGVDLGDADDAVLVQVVRQRHRGAPLVAVSGGAAHDQPGGMHGGRFDVVVVAAGVADVRIGQGDDLAAVGRIGEDFLIAGHRRVEHDFAGGDAIGADRDAMKQAAVRKGQQGRKGRHGTLRRSVRQTPRAGADSTAAHHVRAMRFCRRQVASTA
jgi:hypothetical protein